MLKLTKPHSSHEELFIERYKRLRAWALRLVQGDQQQADDLLHDAFIHFTLHRSVVDHVEDLDAYLYTMLRNLRLSQARRLARTPHGHLSLIDYDSADISLQSVDPRDQIKVQDELRMICRYSCFRKQTSKAGSVLILRFFHGYYPTEIARVMNSPRAAVDNFLKGARSEAKLFLQNPEALVFMRDDASLNLPAFDFGRVSPEILAELRRTIFSSLTESCLSKEYIQTLYAEGSREAIDVTTLSHIVSCSTCLDEVNKHLGIPPLSDRQAIETLGRDNRPTGGGGPSGGASGGGAAAAGFLKTGRRRTKHVFEHRPKELHISVNGFVLGTQIIGSRRSELTLNVTVDEKIAFVEVYSERNVRLFFLNVEAPPDGAVDQVSSIELSDGRELHLALNFSDARPKLHAVYIDPTLAEVGDAISPESLAGGKEEARVIDPHTVEVSSSRKLLVERLKQLRGLTGDLLGRILDVRRMLARPVIVALLATTMLAGAWLVLRTKTSPAPLTAASLLQQSRAKQRALVSKPNQVVHQILALEERKLGSAEGEFIARRRVEIWQSADRGIEARRLYDERNQLVAGDWRRSDGVETLYHHGKSPRVQLVPEKDADKAAIGFDNVWQRSLSAEEFSSLIGESALRVEERGDRYVISAESSVGSQSPVVSAVIVLNKADLHAKEVTVVLRQGSDTREFRLIESVFEEKPTSGVAPTVFEPEAELLSSAKPGTRNAKAGSVAAGFQPPAPVVASPALEVEVLRLLNQAGADMGEQISVTRTHEGLLRVEGVVDTSQRKAEILGKLSSVASDPALRLEIETVADALKRQRSYRGSGGGVVEVEGGGSLANSIPVDAELRRFYSARGMKGTELEDSINQFANQALNRSAKIMQHAWALKRLAARFSPGDLQNLEPEARAKWLALIKQHAAALAQQNEALRRDLLPVFAAGDDGAGEGFAIKTSDDLVRAIERLFEVCSASDRVVRQAFAITPNGSKDSTINSAQFRRSLGSAEKIATRIFDFKF